MPKISRVDPTKPASPNARTSDVRNNFATIQAEINDLYQLLELGFNPNSPNFTGTATFQNAHMTGNLTVEGSITASSGPLAQLTRLGENVPLTTLVAGTSLDGRLTRITDTIWWLFGRITNSSGGALAANGNNWLQATGKLDPVHTQFVPCIVIGATIEYDTAVMWPLQSADKINFSTYLQEGGANINLPNGSAFVFNALMRMQP